MAPDNKLEGLAPLRILQARVMKSGYLRGHVTSNDSGKEPILTSYSVYGC